jgi:hypothetical protein
MHNTTSWYLQSTDTLGRRDVNILLQICEGGEESSNQIFFQGDSKLKVYQTEDSIGASCHSGEDRVHSFAKITMEVEKLAF